MIASLLLEEAFLLVVTGVERLRMCAAGRDLGIFRRCRWGRCRPSSSTGPAGEQRAGQDRQDDGGGAERDQPAAARFSQALDAHWTSQSEARRAYRLAGVPGTASSVRARRRPGLSQTVYAKVHPSAAVLTRF